MRGVWANQCVFMQTPDLHNVVQKRIKRAEGRLRTGFLPIRSGPKGSSRNKFSPGRWSFFHLTFSVFSPHFHRSIPFIKSRQHASLFSEAMNEIDMDSATPVSAKNAGRMILPIAYWRANTDRRISVNWWGRRPWSAPLPMPFGKTVLRMPLF